MKNKELMLQEILQEKKNIIIAFSGGVDSTYLLYVASKTPNVNVIAVTAQSPLHMSSEVEFAINYAKQLGVEHRVYNIPLLSYENIVENNKDRCYHCKKRIFAHIINECHLLKGYFVADGTNLNDFDDYRPGLKACSELNIWHPLVEAKMHKSDIYKYSKLHKLPTATKPSFACLASRIPYGVRLTKDNLSQIERAEAVLEKNGFKQYRLRHHGDIARIELFAEDFSRLLDNETRNLIVTSIKAVGFKYVTLDLTGYKQGSMNI